MFNGCAACRRRLARRAEGSLPRSQWARLEAHLGRCAGCRRIDEADRALHYTLSMTRTSSARMTRDAATAFDDRVLDLVLNQPTSLWRVWIARLRDRLRFVHTNGPALFISQVAGGAIAAAALTASCLTISIKPQIAQHYTRHNRGQEFTVSSRWLHGPPVPLEALMDTPSPRAAMLWTQPPGRRKVAEVKDSRRQNQIGARLSPAGSASPGLDPRL